MSPLILVGLLAISSLTPSQADVKHVLEGSAHPPGCTLGDDHHHHHHDSAGAGSTNSFGSSSHYSTSGSFGSGSIPHGAGNNNGVPGSVAFWWADANSPFKHAYEYFKKCSLKGNCLPPVAPGFQLPNNLPQSGCNGNGCTVSGSFEYKTTGSHFGPIDVKKNVFLNGNVQGVAGGAPGCSGGNCKAESGTFHFTTSSHGSGIKGAGTGGGVGCSGNNCGSGSGDLFFHGTTQGANDQNKGFGCSGSACKQGSSGQTFFQTQSTQSSFSGSGSTGGSGHINVAGNPFLNGDVNLSGNKHTSFGTTSGHFDLNKNPFLSGSSQTSQTQSAYSGNGQAVSTGSDGFLGVQPHAPFGKNNDKAQPFPTAHPGGSSQSFSAEYTFQSGGSSGAPFPTGHPGQDGKFQNCQQAGYTCVVKEQCVNGVVSSHAQQKNSVQYCEIGKEVCCRLPQGAASHQTGSTSSYSSFSSSSTQHASGSFDGGLHGNGFSNLSYITAGKSSFPGSTFKFAGGAGLSPGSIQVLPVNDEAPNPFVSTAGESGSGIHTSSQNSIKVIRNTSQNPNSVNSVFSSTPDYSNDKLDQLSFISTTRGPPYLPPISSPKPPPSHIPDLSPPISTYRPEIPTTSRPITKPVIPGVSIVTPFVPSSPKPFDYPDAQNPVPSYTPKPSIPTASNQYLPPHTSSPTPFVTQPTQPSVSYVPSSSFSTTTRQPFTFSTSINGNNKYVPPKTTPKYDYSPSSTSSNFIPSSNPTPGYSYPTPSPPFEYPKPSPTPSSTVIITEGTKYVPPYKPSPSSTTKLYVPPSPTPGYSYPTPSPPFDYPTQSTNIKNDYVPPKQTPRPTPPPFKYTQKPYNPPTDGYKYPTPSPPFDYPTQSTNIKVDYVPPKQTPRPTPPPFTYTQKPYNPPTGGYSYPTPSPSFPTPTRIPTPPTRSPNEYLPPPLVGTGTNVGNNYLPPPTSPPIIPDEGRVPETRLSAGCAAALKCVQEQFCTAAGFISATPVVLTREQASARVPTTDCYSKETGTSGKCCRDPNYVDPWPSANLINGEDDGQYREDDSLGQYFPMKQRPPRSGANSNSPNAIGSGIGSPSSVSGSFGKPGGFGGQTTVSGSYGKTSGFGGQNTVSTGFGNGYNGQNTASGSFNGQSTVSGGFGKTSGFDGQQTGGFGGQQTGAGGFEGQTTVSGGFGKTSGFGGQQTATGGFGGQQTGTGGFGGQQTGAGSFEGQTTISGGFGKTSGFGAAGGFNGQNTASTGFNGQGSAGFGSGFTNQHSTSGGFEGQTSLSGSFGKTNGFGSQTTGSFEGSVTGGFGQTNGFGAEGSTGGAFGSQGSTSGAFGGQSSGAFGGQGSTSSGFGKTGGFGGQNQHSTSFQKTYSYQYSTQGQDLATAGSGTCGVRNLNTQPRGKSPIDVSFAEIPWQAMVLRDSNRSLLCGGVIVKNNAVLTTAQCIEGLPTSDILIKGGEWKLGIDEEPQPFQIVSVAAAIRHPQYQAGSFQYDMALLMLEETLRIANNVAPICLPPPNQAPVSTQQCIATGWGKRILQVHLRGAIMRSIDINILDSNQCSETLANKFQNFVSQYSSNTICGYSNNDQCDVDYGSALACTNGDGHYSLAGIFSWDTGCKNQDQIGGYTQPDVEWIETTCSKPLSQLRTLDRQYNH